MKDGLGGIIICGSAIILMVALMYSVINTVRANGVIEGQELIAENECGSYYVVSENHITCLIPAPE